LKATRRRVTYQRRNSRNVGIGALLGSRWGVTTALALLAVAVIFVDVLLTVEVQRVSLETHHLNRDMGIVTTELDALESHWASRSSHLELGDRAARLGLAVPGPDQVVLLPASFLEAHPSGAPRASEELAYEYLENWTKLVLVGTP
jgi:hypothetical protein